MQREVLENVELGEKVFTDEYRGYQRLGADYRHESVNHSHWEYVRGDVHTNGIESFWALLKRGCYGTYHHWSPKHLPRYISEFAGRTNARSYDTLDAMSKMARSLPNGTMPYKKLIASK